MTTTTPTPPPRFQFSTASNPPSQFVSGSRVPAPAPPAKTIYDIPVEIVSNMAVKLFMMLNLAWDYVETILEISQTLRLEPGKQLARQIRRNQRIYHQRRAAHISNSDEPKERNLALLFETLLSPHLNKLHYARSSEIKHRCPAATTDESYLIEAVATALTMLDATLLYGAECDARIRALGVSGNSIITPEIRELSRLLPKFLAGRFDPNIPARNLTARIILNELRQIELNETP